MRRAAPVNPFQGHVANWAGRAPAPAAAQRGEPGAGEDARGGGSTESTDMCAAPGRPSSAGRPPGGERGGCWRRIPRARCTVLCAGSCLEDLSPAARRVLARALERTLLRVLRLAPGRGVTGGQRRPAHPCGRLALTRRRRRRLAAKTLLCLTSLDREPEAAPTPRAGGGPASSSETLSEGPADFTPRGATPSGGHFGRAAAAPYAGGARGGGGGGNGGGGGRRGGRGGALARQVSASARHPVLGLLVPSGRRSSARGGDGADSPDRAVPQVPRPPPPPACPSRQTWEDSAPASAGVC
jgi:hypothetical protein